MAYTNKFPDHNRIKGDKPKSTFGAKKSVIKKKATASTEDRAYLNWLHKPQQMKDYTCMVCKAPIQDWHHVKLHSTDKKNHKKLIPLCKQHHTDGSPSPHKTPVLWREKFSMELQNKIADDIYLAFLRNRELV